MIRTPWDYARDLIGLYGVTLPETDPKIISMKRLLEMVSTPSPTPGGCPAVGEQAVPDRAYPDDSDHEPYHLSDWPMD